jgi:hypothetical protein
MVTAFEPVDHMDLTRAHTEDYIDGDVLSFALYIDLYLVYSGFHPSWVGKMSSSQYLVGDRYRRLRM